MLEEQTPGTSQQEESTRIAFLTFGINKWIYLHSCLSTLLQKQSAKVISTVDCWLELEGKESE